MESPLLSIIIPAFNRAHCIGRALRSISAQGIGDFEVLLGDDSSTDETIAAAQEVFPEVRVARLEANSGAAAARNAAASLAHGKFFAFLDSDDEWLPGKLKAQLDLLERRPEVGVCGCGHVLVRANGNEISNYGRNPDDWARSLSFAQSFHGASTPVVHREIWERVGPQDESLRVLEDWDWMLRASRVTGIQVLAGPLAKIHESHPSNPDLTLLSTERFLAKHAVEFAKYGTRTHREIVSQHWENAGRNWLRHRRKAGGLQYLWRSFCIAPWRNPCLLGAFPVAAWDRVMQRDDLGKILATRQAAMGPGECSKVKDAVERLPGVSDGGGLQDRACGDERLE